VAAWIALCIPFSFAAISTSTIAFHKNLALGITSVFTNLFIAYFWLNGMKDVAYPIAYRVMGRRVPSSGRQDSLPLVALLYVTCNDFSAESLDVSIRQDYLNCKTVILDDSSNPECKRLVDEYAKEHDIQVVRRENRVGFKAGNLNNYLKGRGKHFEYFIIVDSDEILPPNFVTRALDYFTAYPDAGIVQANHVATRNRTTFMRTFAPGVDAHWPAYQSVKDKFGFLSLLGHGAMVKREAYWAANGFPNVVAEDIGFAIDAQLAGYRTVFAPDIRCEEEFPPDYAAFKKRHKKWTEGNMEFIRTYTRRILFSRQLRWFEKLDIVLFTYGLPLTGIFSMYVIANAIVFPLAGLSIKYPLWMLVPTIIFLVAPMINDVITWLRSPKQTLMSYLLHSVALFGSVYFVSLFASTKTIFGKSVFHVTPKTSGGVSLKGALRQNRAELIAGAVLAAVVEIASASVLPVILILLPVVFGTYLSVMNAGDDQSGERDGKHILHREG
jgi:cellulose synthase/poly-beta-1,6-N-acetylglucosamine synthase-like glycosyltransferase